MTLKLREFREEMQMTQKELAGYISNVQRNISNWETGISEPDCENLIRLADVFGITVDELLGREPTMIPQDFGGVDRKISKAVKRLNEKQKEALLQFLESFNYHLFQ